MVFLKSVTVRDLQGVAVFRLLLGVPICTEIQAFRRSMLRIDALFIQEPALGGAIPTIPKDDPVVLPRVPMFKIQAFVRIVPWDNAVDPCAFRCHW